MKISVLIIAHNEEEWIEKCIQSILNQTTTPDEIVLIAHNCTDRTVEIVKKFNIIKVVEYNGPHGQPYARIKGFQEVTGDIVACIDGDAWADKNWLKHITSPLLRNPDITLSAGRVVFLNNLFWKIAMLRQYFFRKFRNNELNKFASGACFACRKKDYEKVGGLQPIIKLKDELKLYFWAEDYYLSLALQTIGQMNLEWNAKVYSYMPKENSSIKAQKELGPKWHHDNFAILDYFKQKQLR